MTDNRGLTFAISTLGCFLSFFLLGCGRTPLMQSKYDTLRIKASSYFQDAKVLELCRAIEKNDVAEITRLGKDKEIVNARGKANMTPILWACIGWKLEAFEKLLELGADPTVQASKDSNAYGYSHGSGMHTAAVRATPYLKAILKHGGDANFVQVAPGSRMSLLQLVCETNGAPESRVEKIELLLQHGANIDYQNVEGHSAAMLAARMRNYRALRCLLNHGADPNIRDQFRRKVIHHFAIGLKGGSVPLSPEESAAREELKALLEKYGQSLIEARADNKRWEGWQVNQLDKVKILRKAELPQQEAQDKIAREIWLKARAEEKATEEAKKVDGGEEVKENMAEEQADE